MPNISDILAFIRTLKVPFSFYGDESAEVEGFSSLTRYRGGTVTWVKKAENIPPDADTKAMRLVVASREVTPELFSNVILSEQSKFLFFQVIQHFYSPTETMPAVGEHTVIGPRVKLGRNVRIGCSCTLDGDIVIGDNTVVGHGVTMIHRVHIGSDCDIRSGVVIGHDDSIAYTENEAHEKIMIRHYGGVWIGDRVLVGENSTICRGTIDDTVLGDGVKLDAQTLVSHNCCFEKNSVAVGGSRFYGSVTVGENAYIVGAHVRNQCTIGANATVGMGAVVLNNVEAGQTVVGNPARPYKKTAE